MTPFVIRRVGAALGAAVLAATVLGGCGSTSGSSGDVPSSAATSPSDPATSSAGSASPPADLCRDLTAADLGQAVGATVTVSVGPSGDCEFSQDDARALRGSVGVVEDASSNGGFEGYRSGLAGTITDPTNHEISGLGRAASVSIGMPTMGSGENLMAAGVVDYGSFLVQVTLTQGQKLSADVLLAAAEKVLRLADASIS